MTATTLRRWTSLDDADDQYLTDTLQLPASVHIKRGTHLDIVHDGEIVGRVRQDAHLSYGHQYVSGTCCTRFLGVQQAIQTRGVCRWCDPKASVW
ncbi:hypothetical protein [Kineosporia babensis]|uniref:Uncharacterized protein n=1 Tax=Kineosporia babensis TaxID=499548 RepID=A0A9X1NC04_9ACTN|nr:hypothetical protein [Kineosporia babensis]MCD5310905.1 hypothetical protein [Kineosporia babensis]